MTSAYSRCNLEDSGVEMANRAGRYAVTRNVDNAREETISVAGFKALESENLPNNT